MISVVISWPVQSCKVSLIGSSDSGTCAFALAARLSPAITAAAPIVRQACIVHPPNVLLGALFPARPADSSVCPRRELDPRRRTDGAPRQAARTAAIASANAGLAISRRQRSKRPIADARSSSTCCRSYSKQACRTRSGAHCRLSEPALLDGVAAHLARPRGDRQRRLDAATFVRE